MSKRGVLLAGAAVVLGGVAMVPVAAQGDPSPVHKQEFTVTASPSSVNVTCAAGATAGSASVTVSISSGPGSYSGSNGELILATWTSGGTTIATQTFDPLGSGGVMSSSTVPCPATSADTLDGTVTFTWLKGNGQPATDQAVDPAPVGLTYHRVGSAS